MCFLFFLVIEQIQISLFFLFCWRYRLIMGIHNLAKLIAEQAPAAIKEGEMANYFGRKIAIDA